MKISRLIGAALLALIIVGCAQTPTEDTPAEETEPPAEQGDTYPVTLEHKFGSITLEERPERIVSLGYTEQDPLYALGADPVAIRYWYGDEENAIFPWAEVEAGDAEPVVLNMPYGSLNYEAILALEPDFISAIGSGITAEEYESLSQIAPTLAQSDDYVDFGTPWQVTTLTLGQALGVEAEAEALVADVKAQFEDVREQNPQFQGETVAVAYQSGGTYGYYTAQDGRGRFFTDLGFVVPDELNEIAGESFYADISEERIDLLDQDFLVFLALQFAEDGSEAAREAIETDPLIQQLDVVQNDNVLYVADEYDDALQFSTVLSLEFLLENLVPEIVATLPADAASAGATTADDDCAEGLRLLDHEALATDPICIPDDPQRVIAMDEGIMVDLIALGEAPVGVNDWANRDFTPYIDTSMVESVGTPSGPNYEAMLVLEPDVIIVKEEQLAWLGDGALDSLEDIAPVAITGNEWQESLLVTGAVVNEAEQAENYLETYNERLAEFREVNEGSEDTVAVIRSRADAFNVYVSGTFIADVMQSAGLEFPEEVSELEPRNSISLEQIDMLDSDYLFVMVRNEDEGGYFQQSQEGPLWSFLPAVQQAQVYVVDWSTWVAGWNIVGANMVLDDLYAYLTDEDPQTPNPFADLIVEGYVSGDE